MKIFQSILFLVLAAAIPMSAQILEPVKWSFGTEKVSDTEYNLIFTAHIDDEWTVYSQFTSDDGPVPTMLTFENIDGAELQGKASEKGHKKEGMDKLFGVNVIKFLGDEDFVMTQKVSVSDISKPISGYLTFMTCNDKTCLPPTDVDFSFNLGGGSAGAGTASADAESSNEDSGSSFTISGVDNEEAESEEQEKPSGILKPVTWNMTKKQLSDDEYELIDTAKIDDGWAVYSLYMEEGGPVPTTITYENAEGAELIGKAIESGNRKEGFDPMWKDDVDNVIKFKSGQDFVITQKVKITDPDKPLTGYLNFMTCDDRRCLNPTDVDFDFGFGKLGGDSAQMNVSADGKIDQSRAPIVETYKDPLSDCGKDDTKDDESVLWLLLAGMLGGFAALLTPCVFPMIPITVSFFTKDTKRSGFMNGLIYGLSIIVIYVVLGLIITVTLGPEALQALSTNWIANTIFFLIFIFFAGSFFGYYELTLPSSWSTKSDQMADKGGLLGIFFMAATLALVSFSCTGPIVGSALVAAAEGGFVGPLVVMFGFSFALALPFGLFAAFPTWLNSLPKSGGWMNSVKVVLGFLELGEHWKGGNCVSGETTPLSYPCA